jgi:glycosyltransferase involved in cell wall biosynthesis
MKIAIVVPGGVDRSGEYRVVPALLALVKRLATRHEVHVFALQQEDRPGVWPLLGATVHNIGRAGAATVRVARAIGALGREHRAAPFAVVHSIWSGSSGLVAVAVGKLLGIPSVVHVAGGELIALQQIHYGGRLRASGRVREAVVLRGASAVTAASEPILAELAALGVQGRRVPLGVDLETWPPREPAARNTGAPARLIHAASLNGVKDQPTLLRALALLAADGVQFNVDIVGGDTLGGRMQALAQELKLAPRITFHGFRTHAQLYRLFERADINLVSSLHEAGPLVVLEAAALGVPTAGTDVGHVAEWAPDAASAAKPGDAPALAAAIRRLLDDEPLRLRIATEARLRSLLNDADHTAVEFERLYAHLGAR